MLYEVITETDAEIWDADCEKVFQRTREVLSSLCDAEKQLVNVRIPDPLGLWIELLKEKIYVRRQDAPGISVYPYRVCRRSASSRQSCFRG